MQQAYLSMDTVTWAYSESYMKLRAILYFKKWFLLDCFKFIVCIGWFPKQKENFLLKLGPP